MGTAKTDETQDYAREDAIVVVGAEDVVVDTAVDDDDEETDEEDIEAVGGEVVEGVGSQ